MRQELVCGAAAAAMAAMLGFGWQTATAHHSFAMYDLEKTYVFTGVVLRVSPDSNHLQIFFAPLNDARDDVLRDENGEPVSWAVEMEGAAQASRYGVTVHDFPRGTIFSIGLHPLRNGLRAGGRGKSGLIKCPLDTPPAAGKHCDSIAGSTSHGDGALPTATAVPKEAGSASSN
jgi:Family of unknown function (DUF6152)